MAETARARAIRAATMLLRDATFEDLMAPYGPQRLAELAAVHRHTSEPGAITPDRVRAAFFRAGTPSLSEAVLDRAFAIWIPDGALPEGEESVEPNRTLEQRWSDTVTWLALAPARPIVRGAASAILLAADASAVDPAARSRILKIHERLKLSFVYEKATADQHLSRVEVEHVATSLARAVWGATVLWRQLPPWVPGDTLIAEGPKWFRATVAAMAAYAVTLGSSARVSRLANSSGAEGGWREEIAELVLLDLASLSVDRLLQRIFQPARLVSKAESEGLHLKLAAVGESFTKPGTRRAFDPYRFYLALNSELVNAQAEFRQRWARTFIAPDTQGIAESPRIDAFLRRDGIGLALGEISEAHMENLFRSRLDVASRSYPVEPQEAVRREFLRESVTGLFLINEFADRVLRGVEDSVSQGDVLGDALFSAMKGRPATN